MINKPPELGAKKPEEWIQEWLGYFENVRFEFMKVRGLWFPALYNGLGSCVHGTHPGQILIAGESGYISAVIPRETIEIRQAVIRIIPTTTGAIDWTATVTYGAVGEDEAEDTETVTADDLDVTDDEITEIDVTDLFAAVSQSDQIGLQFTLDAVDTTTNVYLLGMYFLPR